MTILDGYLAEISSLLRAKNDTALRSYLRVEPPLPDDFAKLSSELKASWQDSGRLENHIERLIPESDDDKAEEGGSWPGFLVFMKECLEYWRDVNMDDLARTHEQLSSLANTCITAMGNASLGIIMLPVTIQLCGTLARLASMLDKRPELIRNFGKVVDTEQGERKSLVENTAELIQRAFTICLTERTSNRTGIKDGKPEGKKIGIYSFANMVLKLLFQCRKTRLANQLFTNISANSPPLHLYPASHRVQFLYFLGRYHFSNSHFFYAQTCLESAYTQCYAHDTSHRRLILIHLFAANLILGRFPSSYFQTRPEAQDLLPKFLPITHAIRKGNLFAFKQSLGPSSGHEKWFFHHGILLPLLSRCEPLVWRSLSRRVFLLTYTWPWDPSSKKAASLDLNDVVTAAQLCQKLLEGYTIPPHPQKTQLSTFQFPSSPHHHPKNLIPPPNNKPKRLGINDGIIFRNRVPQLFDKSLIAGLVSQSLLHGFLSHAQAKFAIIGSKQKGGPLNAGFPPPWEVMRERAREEKRDGEVPGWVQRERAGGGGGVFNLTGVARPVGSGG